MNRRTGFAGTLIASALLSAGLVLVVFGAQASDADGTPKKHAAKTRDVTFDGKLSLEDGIWVVKLRGANASARAQDCTVDATVTTVRNSMMARVAPVPTKAWESTVAMRVPASGEASQSLKLPENLAQRVAAKPAKSKAPDENMFQTRETFGVRVKAQCEEKIEVASLN
jgi:hypothetical protein